MTHPIQQKTNNGFLCADAILGANGDTGTITLKVAWCLFDGLRPRCARIIVLCISCLRSLTLYTQSRWAATQIFLMCAVVCVAYMAYSFVFCWMGCVTWSDYNIAINHRNIIILPLYVYIIIQHYFVIFSLSHPALFSIYRMIFRPTSSVNTQGLPMSGALASPCMKFGPGPLYHMVHSGLTSTWWLRFVKERIGFCVRSLPSYYLSSFLSFLSPILLFFFFFPYTKT